MCASKAENVETFKGKYKDNIIDCGDVDGGRAVVVYHGRTSNERKIVL